MLQITTSFHPFRLKMKRREPVQLLLKVKNVGAEKEFVSYEVLLGSGLSMDKSGLKVKASFRIGELEPGKETEEYFEIHPRHIPKEGPYPIEIKAVEHFNKNYGYVKKDYKKTIELIVED